MADADIKAKQKAKQQQMEFKKAVKALKAKDVDVKLAAMEKCAEPSFLTEVIDCIKLP